MGKKNPPDERVVYLTLRKVFKGPNAGVQRPSVIRKLIIGNQQHEDIAALIRTHNIDILCNTTREPISRATTCSLNHRDDVLPQARQEYLAVVRRGPEQHGHDETSPDEHPVNGLLVRFSIAA